VDNGLAMTTPHIDTAHGHHDFDDGCLMYWAAETPAFADTIGARLLGGQTEVPSFDAACLADMAAALE
ncbi:MAG: hypothetical protein KC656_03060, partial [Myxococcales bacterium]|nr:hypothetical protein [Myxococcales bacterium]